ncbi:hypothetical protein BJF79_04745 [Actinomadura sp. CNU-125]|uniref:MMPL family transporter n=1 Tax=Actinomadura sp. CNU-125 TaxID=1904961 RepID=UPI0009675731|nr:MMPL family transporter [Actinomadura sp. CNU-125]OLT11196.1 hypothetical protein BJF79_04745 [Actinomadura sp. CNU-125]
MATLLYQVGRFCFRRRWPVAVVWAGLLVVVGMLAASSPAPPANDFSMPGTEAQRAYELLAQKFPELNADGATARVVFKATDGKVTDEPNRRAVAATLGELGEGPQVGRVSDPYRSASVSADGTTAYAQVSYEVPGSELSSDAHDALLDTVRDARSAGLAVEVGGDAVAKRGGGHSAEALGLLVAAVVLVITFGSLVAAGLPLLTALLGVGLGIGAVKALSGPLGLGTTTSALATMIGLAVGIDYALFVVSRYRSELAAGRDRREAAGVAAGTAGSAVVFAGLTVVIALAGLSVVGVPVLTGMGLAAAGTVALAVLIAVTLVPALLGVAGRRVGPAGPRRGARARSRPVMGVRWARLVVRRPVVFLLAGVAVLGVSAIPVASLELGLPGDGSKPASATQRRAYDMVAEGFGPGFNGPLTVVVRPDGGDARGTAESLAGRIGEMRDVATVREPVVSEGGDTAVLTVIPDSAPGTPATAELVHALRAPGLERAGRARVLVTGSTAMNVDVSQKLADALVPYLTLVVGLAFLLLVAVFRSLLVPLKAALGFLLSVAAALGAVVAVFQWGWLSDLFGVAEPGPVMSITPIFLVGVVFGLAMDYEVFLVTRMREAHVHGRPAREAVVDGFRHGARVVTAAALIMISVFGAFLGSDEQMIKTIGFGLAIAVLLDAFVVRMTLVPAVLALLGDRAWRLPRWLDRLVPNLDVEGRGTAGPQAPPDGRGELVAAERRSGEGAR